MSRRHLTAAFSVVLTALMMPSAHAQDQTFDPNNTRPMLIPGQIPDQPSAFNPPDAISRASSYAQAQPVSATGTPPTPIDADLVRNAGPEVGPVQQHGYVRLGAPLYPTPRPNIPIWTGSTVITNQAFAPHEMLYPHTYKAIYPPFYHRVKGGWVLTPLGVRSHEKWQLQGTQVQVKYRSSYPGLLSGAYWHPPVTTSHQPRWR
jgi:hypothetical protein